MHISGMVSCNMKHYPLPKEAELVVVSASTLQHLLTYRDMFSEVARDAKILADGLQSGRFTNEELQRPYSIPNQILRYLARIAREVDEGKLGPWFRSRTEFFAYLRIVEHELSGNWLRAISARIAYWMRHRSPK